MSFDIFLATDSWFSNPAIARGLWPAVLETIYMVGLSSLITVAIGIPIGLILSETRKGGLIAAPTTNKIVGALVNLGRAIPFIILAIIVLFVIRGIGLPFLKATGWLAFTIALAVSAIPYFARMVESNVLAVEPGKVEAAQMTGAPAVRIMWDVLVREALPSIISSVTILVITIVGYSAMAGAVGGGGLGALAINQGYQRYKFDVIVIVVVVILLMVQMIQWLGDMLSRMVDHR